MPAFSLHLDGNVHSDLLWNYVHIPQEKLLQTPNSSSNYNGSILCNVVQTGLQWYATKWQFVDNGDTRDSVFVSLFDTPNWSSIVGSILVFTCFVLADVLLIWRCFFVWNRSFRVISMPLLLLIIEIGLFLFVITYLALNGEVSTNAAIVNMFNNFACAAYFTTSATSLLTTVLIAYRITLPRDKAFATKNSPVSSI
ncbi:hypothetical protein BJ912DRAFT_634111 [Pholiota molesta]|nr:hypothetical protein BJ912DRAFT_634111 [Pholiota molesta]